MKWIALTLLLAAPVLGQWQTGDITIQPNDIEALGCRFGGRTTVEPDSITLTVTRVGVAAQADASPSAIVTAQTAAGDLLSFKVSPDQGCGTAGCRNGNNYQVKARVEMTDGSFPVCDWLIRVKKVNLTP